MRTIVAGSRTANNYDDLLRAITAAPWKPTEIISGSARGADVLGEKWARENNIPLRLMPANWAKDGNRAGYLRNVEMADCADALLALWNGKSPGTRHMIDIATRKGWLCRFGAFLDRHRGRCVHSGKSVRGVVYGRPGPSRRCSARRLSIQARFIFLTKEMPAHNLHVQWTRAQHNHIATPKTGM